MTDFRLGTDGVVGSKNKIINGDFRIWQRGTVFNSTNQVYTADRWRAHSGTGGVANITRQTFTPGQTDVPGGPESYLRFDQATASAGIDQRGLEQKIENVYTLKNVPYTLSFWIKASIGFTIAEVLAKKYYGSGGSPNTQQNFGGIAVTTAWQKYSKTITIDSLSGKTVGSGSSIGLNFIFPTGITPAIDLANIQVEEGSLDTDFEQRPLPIEFDLCQRYYYRQGAGYSGQASTSGNPVIVSRHPVPMRVTPAIGPLGIVSFQEFGNAAVFTQSSSGIALHAISESAVAMQYNNISGMTALRGITIISTDGADLSAEL